jgi:hypothetical protein
MHQVPHPPTSSFGVRMTPQERAWLYQIAQQETRSGGEVLRWMLRLEAERRGLPVPLPREMEAKRR